MKIALPLLALATLIGFLVPLVLYVPRVDLVTVIVIAVALAIWDFANSIRKGEGGR